MHVWRFIFFIIILLNNSCSPRKEASSFRDETVVIGIANDFDHLNPLLIQFSISREVCMLLYPKLVQAEYDSASGEVRFQPMLATRWTFSSDGKQATFFLRGDAKWDDGTPITSADLKFSYRLYANPAIASTRQHYVSDFVRDKNGEIDFDNAVQTPNDTTLILNFSTSLAPNIVLDHFYDLMPISKHQFESVEPKQLRAKSAELPLVSAGAFRVEKWERQNELILVRNESSVLPHPSKLKRLIFRIIPDYTTRLTAFKSGQIDVMMASGGIAPRDAIAIEQEHTDKKIYAVQNRLFDSIVWLCVDGNAYRERKELKPHALFGDKRVRQALTYAINREAIIEGYVGEGKATIVNTSLSPAYKKLLNPSLHPYAYNPEKALLLLKEAGWTKGNDGFLQKNGKRFSFTLSAPKGNDRRTYAGTIVQQNLKEIGIECKLETLEMALFNQRQNNYELDAALSGLSAETLPFQLVIWAEDSPFNSSVFRNARFSKVIEELGKPQSPEQELALWQEYQAIQHEEQPRTFLYYYDEFEGFHSRIKNVTVSMLAILFNAHEWEIAP
ncbi:MAG: ABC transporter substrate-binding protein [Chlorobiales bacterium]